MFIHSKWLTMKKTLTAILICCCLGSMAQQTTTVKSTTGTTQTVYTKTGTDAKNKTDKQAAIDSAKKYSDANYIAATKYTDVSIDLIKKYCSDLISQYFKEANMYTDEKTALETKKLLSKFLSFQSGNDLRFDSIAPGVYKPVFKYSWDEATKTMKKNY